MIGMQRAMLRLHLIVLASIFPDLKRWVSLPRLLAWFTPRGESRLYRGLSSEEIQHVVLGWLARPLRMRGLPCLRRGLLLFYFLRLAGHPAVLHFGVYAQRSAREQAHCWVSLEGKCLADPPIHAHVVVLTHGQAA